MSCAQGNSFCNRNPTAATYATSLDVTCSASAHPTRPARAARNNINKQYVEEFSPPLGGASAAVKDPSLMEATSHITTSQHGIISPFTISQYSITAFTHSIPPGPIPPNSHPPPFRFSHSATAHITIQRSFHPAFTLNPKNARKANLCPSATPQDVFWDYDGIGISRSQRWQTHPPIPIPTPSPIIQSLKDIRGTRHQTDIAWNNLKGAQVRRNRNAWQCWRSTRQRTTAVAKMGKRMTMAKASSRTNNQRGGRRRGAGVGGGGKRRSARRWPGWPGVQGGGRGEGFGDGQSRARAAGA
ncbi:hypothetical protein DFH27DRAFT_609847 [Peziza echinospora]|nr:hypothetical protein DFH27DRAFT_609847 [Peziza echinospora]